jgi:hypothetical protein
MIWRVLGGVAGLGVVATATHLNVLHVGGYNSVEAPLIIAVAALVAIGMGFGAWAWGEGRRWSALLLWTLILAGEGYWVLTNADRELVARQKQSAPITNAERERELAEKRLNEAKKAKADADKAAVEEAAKPGCKTNCAALLMAAQAAANAELAEARKAQASATVPQAQTALAASFGIEQSRWDLFIAALRSGMTMAGALALGIAIHPGGTSKARSAPNDVPAPVPPPKTAVVTLARPMNKREHVSQFLKAVIQPNKDGDASLRALHGKYPAWCRARAIDQISARELGQELRTIIDTIGLECEQRDGDVIIRGASLR